MKRFILGFMVFSSICATANETFCQCKLIRAATHNGNGGSNARVDLELMQILNGQVGRISTLGNYFGESQNWNWQKAVDRAQKKCEDAMENHNACN